MRVHHLVDSDGDLTTEGSMLFREILSKIESNQ